MTALSQPQNPILRLALGCIAVLLLWLIGTRSLVAFLETAYPDRALQLNASNAGARLTLANKAIDAALNGNKVSEDLAAGKGEPAPGRDIASLPGAMTEGLRKADPNSPLSHELKWVCRPSFAIEWRITDKDSRLGSRCAQG